MRWDLVIFDCDGVLIDSELLSVRADRECLAECGIELTEAELLERYTGISWAGMVADLVTRHGPLPADLDERYRRGRGGHERHRLCRRKPLQAGRGRAPRRARRRPGHRQHDETAAGARAMIAAAGSDSHAAVLSL